MKAHWLVQRMGNNSFADGAERLVYALQERGNPVTVFDGVHFGGTDYGFIPEEGPCIFLGSCNILGDIREKGIQTPGPFAWYDADSFRCGTYYEKLSPFILQEDAIRTTLGGLRPSDFPQARRFIRPDDNEKSFTGQLVECGLRDAFIHHATQYKGCDPSTVVYSCREAHIEKEWRLVMVEGVPVAGSQYKTHTIQDIEPGFPVAAGALATLAADRWSPAPVFIMDIGKVGDDYRVVEIGPFNYAGLYMADAHDIAESVSRYAEGS